MIEINDITKRYGKLNALNNINLKIDSGSSVAVIGPNGSGKTTLIKSILGLVNPDSGKIYINGINISKNFSYKDKIGYMPQIGRYPDNLTPNELFQLLIQLRNINPKDELNEMITEFGIQKYINKKMRTLSGGTRQKVSAIISLLFNPEILILDEPMAGLDPLTAEMLKSKLINYAQLNNSLIMVSHNYKEIEGLCKNIIYIMDGNILIFDEIRNIININHGLSLEASLTNQLFKMTNDN